MPITLSKSEIQAVEALEVQAKAGQIGYWRIYEWLANNLQQTKGIVASDPAVLWLRGATEANADRGSMAALIREYTQTQNQLRYGSRLSDAQMRAASNAVAQSLLDDLLGRRAPRWPRGDVPDITRIAEADATAVGLALFNRDPNDTAAALQRNSAWSGTLLFSLLRSDQTSRLMSTGTAGQVDTLNDLRDVLFAFRSYGAGLRAAAAALATNLALSQTGTPEQRAAAAASLATDTAVLLTTFASLPTKPDVPFDWNELIVNTTSNPVLKAAFTVIAQVNPERFLDMLMGAVAGKPLIGNTTSDELFKTNATAFFGKLTPAQLQSLSVQFLPANANSLAALARTDVNVRAALAGLSVVSVQVSNAVAQRFSVYNAATGTGEITDSWIVDRAAMTEALFVKFSNNLSGAVTGGLLGRTITEAVNYEVRKDDGTLAGQVQVGAADTNQQRVQVIFGGGAADTINGSGRNDRLYGGSGADTLNGLGGNDYIEGNAGADKLDGGAGNDHLMGGADADIYNFTGSFGRDLIEDSDGKGVLQVEGFAAGLPQGKRLGEGQYRSVDGKVTYTLTRIDDARTDLIVWFADRPDTITIRNWRSGQFGITLDEAAAPPAPAPTPVQRFDLATAQGRSNWSLNFTLPQTDNWTVLNANASGRGFVGTAGGNDVVEGGSSAVSGQTFFNGGAGQDRIYSGAQVTLSEAIAAGEQQLSTGRSVYMLAGDSGNDLVVGAGDDDALFGGEGDDTLVGGAGGDVTFADGNNYTARHISRPASERLWPRARSRRPSLSAWSSTTSVGGRAQPWT